jgi:hypothetical protein
VALEALPAAAPLLVELCEWQRHVARSIKRQLADWLRG